MNNSIRNRTKDIAHVLSAMIPSREVPHLEKKAFCLRQLKVCSYADVSKQIFYVSIVF